MNAMRFVSCGLALCLGAVAGAEEAAKTEAAAGEAEATATAAAEAPAAVPAEPVDVWWGNRSISYGNYIRFERIGVAAAPAAPAPLPANFNNIIFDKGKALLRPESRSELDRLVRYLQSDPSATVVLEGHTAEGEPESWGQRRADTVKAYLKEQGIAEGRVTTRNAGDKDPWVGGAQGSLNRRVVIILSAGGSQI